MLIPIILCGGVGTRLWPISRETHSKPFIRLHDEGVAEVINDEGERLLRPNESTYIPAGGSRLSNPGAHNPILIEVQSRQYLGEHDIARTEDKHGRA